jgi:mono/diheme cytochrome c family protein
MRPAQITVFALLLTLISLHSALAHSSPPWHEKRELASDLEVSGALSGLPSDSTRYITRDELLAIPQVTFTITDDTNFSGPTKIRGVRLEDLMQRLATSPSADMVVAICDDGYRANYPQAYLAAHHPVLVLEVNGKPPSGWPKDSSEHTYDMGPYMISNPKFTPSFHVLSHTDEAQIPWGVVRIEFRDEKTVFGAIAPHGPRAREQVVEDGFRIAQQNCYRCHNAGKEGGQKSGIPWTALGAFASSSPAEFAAYIHDPRAKNPQAQMPGNPQYYGATLVALTAYFQTFASPKKP